MKRCWWNIIPLALVSGALFAAPAMPPVAEEEVSLTWDTATETAFASDPTLEALRARRRAQQFRQTRALMRLLPQANLAATVPFATASRISDSVYFANYPDPIGFLGIQVRHELWNGGRNWAEYELSKDEEESFVAEGDLRKFKLRLELVPVYYAALRDQQLVEFRESVVQILQRMRSRAGNYFRAQALGRVDRARIEIAFKQASQDRDYALFLAADSEQKLARMLRLKPGQRIRFAESFPSTEEPLPNVPETRDHPAQRRYEANDHVLRDLRRKEISTGLPQLSMYGSFGFRARTGGKLDLSEPPKASVGVALIVPLTEAFAANAAWNEYEENVRRNEFERRETINDLRYDREKLTRQITLVRPILDSTALENSKILGNVGQITAAYVLGETSIGGWLESFGAVKERKTRQVQLEYDHAVAFQSLKALANTK